MLFPEVLVCMRRLKPPDIALAACAVLCAFYGVTVMLVDSGTFFFLVWYALAAVFAALAVLSARGTLHSMSKRVKQIGGTCVCVGAAAVLVAAGCSLSGFGARGQDDLDYLVVLGAQVYEDGPSVVLQHRLDVACAYLQENPRTKCIVSGGKGSFEPTAEAPIMARYLEQHGIASERILQEPASLNTRENVANSMQLVDLREARVGIVTNNFHVFRGVGIARKQGMQNACGIAAPTDVWYIPNNVLRESLSILKDYALGNL